MTRLGAAIVTGGGTGIGRATVIALARSGFDVVIAGRRSEPLEQTSRQVERECDGVSTMIRVTDVGEPEECESLVADAIDRLGRIAVLINAAATFEMVHSLEVSAENWGRMMDINLRGTALCSAEAARHMRDAGGGRIVLVSSLNAVTSEPSSAAYSATKAGVSSLARSLAVDLAEFGISVNAVAPGWILTPMTAQFARDATPDALRRLNPLGRLGEPEEIASVVAYLATDAPAFLTGATVLVDGGQTASAPWVSAGSG